jgi:hypothetical protein
MLRELSELARRLGVGLRFEPFEGSGGRRGGLCRLRGQAVIVVDEALPVVDQVEVLAGALATFDLEKVYLPPQLRLRLERRVAPARRAKAGPTLRKAKTRPRAHGGGAGE